MKTKKPSAQAARELRMDTTEKERRHGENEEEAGRWTAIGRIIGPALPKEIVMVGSVKLIPVSLVPAETLPRLPTWPIPTPRMTFTESGTDEHVDSYEMAPPMTTIYSEWILTIEVDAEGVEHAEEQARELLEEALSSLHLHARAPYVAEILRYEGPTTGINQSLWVGAHAPLIEDLTNEAVALANELVPRVETDLTSKVAAAYIRKGVALGRSALVVPELGSAVLLAYFMAIERISDDVTKDLRRAMDAELTEKSNNVAAKLRADLARSDVTDGEASELIREAAKELSRVRFFYADLKVQRAGERLGLEERIVDEARAFGRFRNHYLGHPRSEIPVAESSRWFEDDLAFRLSNAFLGAYIQLLGDDKKRDYSDP